MNTTWFFSTWLSTPSSSAAFWNAGPDVTLIGNLELAGDDVARAWSSPAPAARTAVRDRARRRAFFAAAMNTLQVLLELGCPTNSSSRRGRRSASLCASSG
jgi:hypothetical protein